MRRDPAGDFDHPRIPPATRSRTTSCTASAGGMVEATRVEVWAPVRWRDGASTDPPGPTTAGPRCGWASGPWLAPYHDEEWGVPVHDDRRHFEFLTLEAAQAGLSWLTVLKRREGYRRAFADFDPEAVARFG